MELILAKEVEETRVLKVKGNDLAEELEHLKKELKKCKLRVAIKKQREEKRKMEKRVEKLMKQKTKISQELCEVW